MNPETGASFEKPLSGFSKLILFCGAGATILLCYVFSSISVLLLLALLACESILVLALARVALAGFMAQIMGRHLALTGVFIGSLRLRKAVEFRIQVQAAEAPELFGILTALCQRASVALPNEVSLEMNVNAWVRLKGYRRGAGKTILGIGYDLLAGLSQNEIEAVLAHEIMHAKLVQRGYKRWLNGGLSRIGQLAGKLAVQIESARIAKHSSELAQFFFRFADTLARMAARLVAACSRQDEFDADSGAARLCNAAVLRSSLLKIEGLNKCTARLPWNERVARLESGEGFSQWLVSELAAAEHAPAADTTSNLFHKYSTHPSLQDRLAALPPTPPELQHDSKPAIALLAEPDKVAEKLISEIQRVAAEQEQADTKRLRRWTRKTASGAHLRPLQLLGVGLLLSSLLGALIAAFTVGFSGISVILFVAGMALGVVCFRFGRFRTRLALPVPDFAALKAAWQNKPPFTVDQAKQIESELRARFTPKQSNRQKSLALAHESFAALGLCDYGRAHVAARLSLEAKKKSVEGALGLVVAAAALGQGQQVRGALSFLQKTTGMHGASITWGAAWALLLCGDWATAEALLEKALKELLDNPTMLLLLALCQSRRGKLQSAIVSARRACAPQTTNKEHPKFLIDLLLQAGYLREAQELLRSLEAELRQDPELMFAMVRLHLLRRDLAAAGEWTQLLKDTSAGAHMFVRLGEAFETARQPEQASDFYNQALAAGHYPEGRLGLGRLEAERRNKDQARRHVLAALDLNRPLGPKATGPLPLFHRTLSQLIMLEDPVADCRAYVARLTGSALPAALVNTSFLIYARERPQAEQSLKLILDAMQPGMPPFLPTAVSWSEAPKQQQPDIPVRPGVQKVI